MKNSIIVLISLCIPIAGFTQDFFVVDGPAKVTQMAQMNSANQVVVRLADGTLAQRDITTLFTEGSGIEISGGFIDALDDSPFNEIQDLSFDGTNLSISKANSVSLADLQSPWNTNGNNIYYNQGNVGINTSSPQEKFHVVHSFLSGDQSTFEFYSGSVNISTPGTWPGIIGYEQSGKRRDIVFRDYGTHLAASTTSSGTDIFNGLWIRDGGNVGIRTWNPGDYPLLVNELAGTSRGFALYNDTNNHLWELYSQLDGRLGLYRNNHALRGTFHESTGVYAPVSDRRLKEDIRPLNTVLKSLMLLKPSTYVMKASETDERQIGFIAQEVEPYFPELAEKINTDSADESLYTLNYGGITVIAVKAIQEQQKIIEEQASAIVEIRHVNLQLENRLQEMEKELKDLKSLLVKN